MEQKGLESITKRIRLWSVKEKMQLLTISIDQELLALACSNLSQ